MRSTSILLVIAIGLSILTPGGIIHFDVGHGGATIGTLDVCHHGVSGNNPDLPYLSQCPCRPFLSMHKEVCEIISSPFKPLLIVFQDEHPPRV